jgi:uncharacterized surface anchored protein
MKKRILATLVGAFIVVNTFAGDMVSFAEENNEIVEVAKEAEAAEVAEEATEDDAAVDAEETETTEEETEVEAGTETTEESSEEEETEENAVIEVKTVAFEQSKVVGDTRINMSAAAGVFPEDAYFQAVEITGNTAISSIEDAVESELSAKEEVVKVKAFDITVYNKDGVEIQPNTDAGNVNVTLTTADTKSADEVKVFHVEDSFDSAEQVASQASGEQVSFEAEHFSTYAMVTVIDSSKNSTETDNPYALVKELKIDGLTLSEDSTKPTKIKKNQTIKVEYIFKDVLKLKAKSKTAEGIYIEPGETYQLPSIPSVCVPTEASIPVPYGNETFGTITFDKDGNASFEITYTPTEGQDVTLDPAGFVLEFTFKEAASSTQEEYTLAFGDKTYYVKIEDFMAQPPTIAKTNTGIDNDGNIEWTVTIRNNDKPIEYKAGYTFTDTIGTGHTYVKGSFKGATLDSKNSKDSKLVWTYKDNTPGAVNTFTYKTHVDFLALTKDFMDENKTEDTVKEDVSNTVKVTADPVDTDNYSSFEKSVTGTLTVSKTVKKWIDKTGGEFNASADNTGVAHWTITMKNNGYTLSNVKLHDEITADEGVDITISNLTISSTISEMTKGTDYTVEQSPSGRSQVISFINPMSGDATYTIEYDATIKKYKEYLKANHTVPSNKAWVTYKYDADGDGVGESDVIGPEVTKAFKGKGISANAALKKEFVSLDASKHTMTWKITVNENEQELYNVVVTDKLPTGHIFDDCKVTGVDLDKVSVSDDKKTVTVRLGDLTKVKTFTIDTKLEDSEKQYWASNQKTKTYTNTVELESFDDSKNPNSKVTATAAGTYKSTVLTKDADSYNYNTHQIRYVLTINSNKMDMNDINVTDALDSKLKLVDDSVKLISGADAATGFASSYIGQTLKVHFDNLKDEAKVEFYAEVVDDDVFAENETTTIENKAAITSSEYGKSVSSGEAVKTNIENVAFKKERGTITNDIVPYVIKINQAQKPIYKDGTDEVYVFDTLGASLTLDKTSVKLYEADVLSDGTMKKGTEVTNSKDINFGKDGRKTTLKVVLPNTSKAYILEYSAAMTNKAAKDFSNSAVLKGGSSSSELSGSIDLKGYSWAGAQMQNMVYCVVNLTDERTGAIIANAKFELYDGDTLIDEGVTDENGDIYFVGAVEEGKSYTIKQTSTTGIYVIPDDLQKGTVEVKGVRGLTEAEAAKKLVKNSKPKKEIIFELLDSKDKKTDLTNYSSTPGVITVKDSSGNEVWNSSTSSEPFKALYGETYTVTESITPFGYKGEAAKNYTFTVSEDEATRGEIILSGQDKPILSGNTITMYDSQAELITVRINDLSANQRRYLKGAKFVLSSNGKDLFTWDSDGKTYKELQLPEGSYKLVRTDEPNGFKEETKVVEFTLDSSILGDKLTVTTNTGNNEVDASSLTIDVLEETDSTKAVTLDPIVPTVNGNKVDGAKTEIAPVKYEDGVVINAFDDENVTWTSDSPATNVSLAPETLYAIKTTDGAGHESIKFVMVKANSDGTTSLVEVKSLDNIEDPSNIVEMQKDENGNYVVKSNVTVPTPAVNNGGSSSTTNNYYYSPAKTAANDELKDKEITALANTDAAASNGGRLAKTGGFLGTLTGYLAAALLMLVGAYLVFGNRKRVK